MANLFGNTDAVRSEQKLVFFYAFTAVFPLSILIYTLVLVVMETKINWRKCSASLNHLQNKD